MITSDVWLWHRLTTADRSFSAFTSGGASGLSRSREPSSHESLIELPIT